MASQHRLAGDGARVAYELILGRLTLWIVVELVKAQVRRSRLIDPFPYGLLTMIVLLEAIFLSTFVLISQNRLGEETEHRADLDLHIGLLTEHELTRVLQILDAIQDKMGIESHEESDLADLEMETRPEDVLIEIERLQQRALKNNYIRPGLRPG